MTKLKVVYGIILLTLILIGTQGCGVLDSLHEDLDCAIVGQNCKVGVDEFERYKEEQEAKLGGIDAKIDDALELLGLDRLDITEIINLCDNDAEILIRIDGMLVAYNNGRGGYLDFLDPGRYITTDGNFCVFTVTQNMEIVYGLH